MNKLDYIKLCIYQNGNFCNYAKLTKKFIEKHFYNVIFSYKNRLYQYHNGYVTVYKKNGDYENSFICNVNNYNFSQWKKIVIR